MFPLYLLIVFAMYNCVRVWKYVTQASVIRLWRCQVFWYSMGINHWIILQKIIIVYEKNSPCMWIKTKFQKPYSCKWNFFLLFFCHIVSISKKKKQTIFFSKLFWNILNNVFYEVKIMLYIILGKYLWFTTIAQWNLLGLIIYQLIGTGN